VVEYEESVTIDGGATMRSLTSQPIAEAMQRADLDVYDDVSHGWQLLTPFVPEAREALSEVAEFVGLSFRAAKLA
jgi:acetyl esterase/lipase